MQADNEMKMVEDDRSRLISEYIPSIGKKNSAKKAAGLQDETEVARYYELVQAPFLVADFTITERLKTIKQSATLVFRQSFLHLQHTGEKTILLSPSDSPTDIKTGKFMEFSHNLPPFPE